MDNPRQHGSPPYSIAVIHGGPGAAGEMSPVAQTLSEQYGVLEPLQTAESVQGQIDELRLSLCQNGNDPFTLIGFSWGAWLSCLLAADHPQIIEKIILIGAAGFESRYAPSFEDRIKRLELVEKDEFLALVRLMDISEGEERDKIFQRLGELFTKADSYDADTSERTTLICNLNIFESVWREAAELREHGELLKRVSRIQCPVIAIHGEHDPHPADGVKLPLSDALDDFTFLQLENCGHKPWIERQAKDKFYHLLNWYI